MTPERYKRITSVLDKRQPDLTVITDEVHKGRNLAAIIRSCDAVGVDQIHSVMPQEGYQTYSGTSASAQKWVYSRHYSSIQEPMTLLKEQGFQIVAANLTPDAVDFRSIDYTKPTALLLGAEVKGVSEHAQSECDYNISLPMVGMVESYNVSVVSAVILLEAQRQRELAGLYKEPRLPESIYKHRFFNWAHPVLAEYCDKNNLAYPETREDGEVNNLSEWYKSVQKSES